MAKVNILNNRSLDITISRLSQQLIETHDDFQNSVMIGLQPRGIFLAERLKKRLLEISKIDIPLGYLDTTFHRDDFRRREEPAKAYETKINFIIEGKKVILVDDVLYTGRTIRAALSAMQTFGRAEKVELLSLIDRKYNRDLPIQPDYIGKTVNTIQSQRVQVEWKEQGFNEDNIWLITTATN